MAKRRDLTVPRAILQEGIARALAGSRNLLRAAEVLAKPCPTVASALFSCAVEEVGKAALLRKGLEDKSDSVQISGFYDHKTKLEVAGQFIPKAILLLVEGAFQSDSFQKNAFQVDVVADLNTRVKSLWTDAANGRWVPEPNVNPDLLARNIAEVGQEVEKLVRDWCS